MLGLSARLTYYNYKRPCAYECPTDEFRRSGSSGRHPQAAARRDTLEDKSEDPSPGETRMVMLGLTLTPTLMLTGGRGLTATKLVV